MPPFDAGPVGRPFLGVPGAADPLPRPARAVRRRRAPEGSVTGLTAAAVVAIGGAGASYPLLEMLAELLSLGLLAHVLARRGARPAIGALECVLLALLVAVPLAQLVPLPPDWWSGLPGRSLPRAVLAAAGLAPSAQPFSLAPAATLSASLAMLPGIAFFLAVRGESAAGRRTLARTVLASAIVSAALGAMQVAAGPGALNFQSAHAGQAIGLFVNRNHQAALLLIAICLTPAALRAPGARQVPPTAFGLVALLAAGVIATTSRTALVLLPLCLLPTLWPLLCRSPRAAAAAASGVALLILAGWWQGGMAQVIERFGGTEARPEIWRTSWAAVQGHWPAGTGIGAFRSVYPLAESRAALTPLLVNHAHDDVIELLLEAGAAAGLGLALFALWYARTWLAARRSSVRGLAPVALGGIAVLLAWSMVDYPLRTLALTAVFGMLCGLAGELPARTATGRWRLALLPLIAVLGLIVARDGLVRHRLLGNDPGGAVALDARSAAGWTALADQALARGEVGHAADAARHALALAPLDQHALTLWAVAQARAGGQATRAWDVAGRLGWRDPLTQLMLFALAADAGDMGSAAARADALLRQARIDPASRTLLRVADGDPRFAAAMAALLATDPPWRSGWLLRLDDLDAAGVARHATLLHAMRAAHHPLHADEAVALVARARAVGRDDVAQTSWAMLVGSERLGDPTLARVDAGVRARAAIGGWHRTALPGLDPDAGGALLLDRSLAGTLVYQDLYLSPGRYALVADIANDAPPDGGTLRPTVTCIASDARLDGGLGTTAAAPSRNRLRAVVTVPPGCVRQRLALDGTGAGIGTASIRVSLSLTPY